MEISWIDRGRNERVLHKVKGNWSALQKLKMIKVNWMGGILRRNCLQKHVIEGKIDGRLKVTRRRGKRRKQLLMILRKINSRRKQ